MADTIKWTNFRETYFREGKKQKVFASFIFAFLAFYTLFCLFKAFFSIFYVLMCFHKFIFVKKVKFVKFAKILHTKISPLKVGKRFLCENTSNLMRIPNIYYFLGSSQRKTFLKFSHVIFSPLKICEFSCKMLDLNIK